MEYWLLAILSLFLGLSFLVDVSLNSGMFSVLFSFRKKKAHLQTVIGRLQEVIETIEAGLVPTSDKWDSLRVLGAPWGDLCGRSLLEIREGGGEVLPSLRRAKDLAETTLRWATEGHAKSAQAMFQVYCGLVIVPIVGAGFYALLPEISEQKWNWILATAVAWIWCCVGAVWILGLSERATWGGLKSSERAWLLSAQCTAERVLAFVRSGETPDLAWVRALELLQVEAPRLAVKWGGSVWETKSRPSNADSSLRTTICNFGFSLKSGIQLSLREGRPVGDRLETLVKGFQTEAYGRLSEVLATLPNRALIPLFVCVAPSLFGLFFYAMVLGSPEWSELF